MCRICCSDKATGLEIEGLARLVRRIQATDQKGYVIESSGSTCCTQNCTYPVLVRCRRGTVATLRHAAQGPVWRCSRRPKAHSRRLHDQTRTCSQRPSFGRRPAGGAIETFSAGYPKHTGDSRINESTAVQTPGSTVGGVVSTHILLLIDILTKPWTKSADLEQLGNSTWTPRRKP